MSADRKAVGQIDKPTKRRGRPAIGCQPIGKPLARSTWAARLLCVATPRCQPIGKPLARSTCASAVDTYPAARCQPIGKPLARSTQCNIPPARRCCPCQPIGKPLARSTQDGIGYAVDRMCQPIGKPLARSTVLVEHGAVVWPRVSADRKAVGQIDLDGAVRWCRRVSVSADRKAVGQIDAPWPAQKMNVVHRCQPIGKPLARSTGRALEAKTTGNTCQPIGKPLARSTRQDDDHARVSQVSADRKAVGQIDCCSPRPAVGTRSVSADRKAVGQIDAATVRKDRRAYVSADRKAVGQIDTA